MGVIAKGIPRGGQGLCTPVSLGYPLSVFNKTLLSKSVWDRPEGGGYVWIPKFRSLCLHTGLVSPDIGSLLQPPVLEFREWAMAAALRPVPHRLCCRFSEIWRDPHQESKTLMWDVCQMTDKDVPLTVIFFVSALASEKFVCLTNKQGFS